MNGAHDLGGMHYFGPISPEADEPIFHEQWERQVFALNLAMGSWGKWNIDKSRYARERLEPALYLKSSYYERWVLGLQTLLVENGFVTEQEILDREQELSGDVG